ncbi:MAG: AAA family ATPase [Planctomycetota bacterium]|jgi:DNA sulfur modification protein DndD
MRIEKITLNNYRQFRDAEISFNRNRDSDLHIVIGRNGTGKTNVLNAINWCLYNDEPHLSKVSQQLPLLNLKAIEEADYGKNQDITVELWARAQDDKCIIFSRRAVYRVYKDNTQPMRQTVELEVRVIDDEGSTNILKNDEADSYVERFVPNGIREFFFFDGERLDNYFKEATVQNIRHAVFGISQIELLENRIERRLGDILRELRKQAGKASPEIEETRNNLEEVEGSLRSIKEQIEKCYQQIAIAKTEIRECNEKTKGVPEIEPLRAERLSLKASAKHVKGLRTEAAKEKQDLLFEYGQIIMLWPAIKECTNIIKEKRKKGEIPPNIAPSLVEGVLREKTCNICGRDLDDESEKAVTNLLDEIKLSSDIAQQLLDMEVPLHGLQDRMKQFKKSIRKVTKEIITHEKHLEQMEEKINQIDKKTSGYNEKQIKGWYEKLKKFEDSLAESQQKLGGLKAQQQECTGRKGPLEKRLNEELNKEQKLRKLKKQIDFCGKSLDVVRKTKEVIMREVREKIESETRDLFFKLLWKKKTFRDVHIEEDYNINLIHSMGYECLGSVGAAERELLALSFTLALHTISGFDSPILVDTPVARVSDEHRENFGKIFSEISSNKQTVLLFTPAEYSPDISKLLDVKGSSKCELKLSSDEKETKVEVL